MWKNLKGYFIVEEEGELKPKSPSTAKAAQPQPAANATSGPKPAPATPPENGKVAEKFVNALMQAMEKANLPGFDYLEYKKALENLQKMGLDDANRYKAAYAAAQSMGVNPAQLIDSANHYLTVLGKEEEKFRRAVGGQRNEQIAKRKAQLTELDGKVKEQEARIKQLQEQIAKTKDRQAQLRKSIAESEGKIATTVADFDKTYRTITGNISADVAKMQQFLK